MDFMKNKHKACVNFESGRCKIFHFAIDPKRTACPHFKAKKEKKQKLKPLMWLGRTRRRNYVPYTQFLVGLISAVVGL
jgi:hypothetical protein